jgi:FKBP-type peptidyl-prolyl cis-trans isomerase
MQVVRDVIPPNTNIVFEIELLEAALNNQIAFIN